MAPSAGGNITRILQRWDSDRQAAVDALTPIVYGELHRIAAAYLRRQRSDHTLQPTALINEHICAWSARNRRAFDDRTHFYTVAAKMMRQILVDTARAHLSEKRGSGKKVQLDEKMEIAGNANLEFLAVHEALDWLQTHNERLAQAVELRYFGGLQLSEIAEALSTSLATVKRDLTLGEAWLRRALAEA